MLQRRDNKRLCLTLCFLWPAFLSTCLAWHVLVDSSFYFFLNNVFTLPRMSWYFFVFLYAVFKVQSSILRISKDPSGEYEIRTRDLLLARQALSQLSYTPKWYVSIFTLLMGLSGLEPPTSRLSGVRSNRLSYKPNQNNLIFKSGSHLLSHTVSSIVSSAVWVLTIVFGMCTGVSPKRIATRIVFTSWIHWKLLRNFCCIQGYWYNCY